MKWINTDEQLPEPYVTVLVAHPTRREVVMAYFDDREDQPTFGFNLADRISVAGDPLYPDPAWWMPVPQPPTWPIIGRATDRPSEEQ